MATKKTIISFNEQDLNVKEIIHMGIKAPVDARIAAIALIEDQINKLKDISEMMSDDIKGAKYDSIIKQLVDSGKLPSSTDEPVIEVTTHTGKVIKTFISAGVEKGFSVDSYLSESAVLRDLVPECFKKTVVGLDKKALEAAYDDGTLPDVLKKYISKHPVEITKLLKKGVR